MEGSGPMTDRTVGLSGAAEPRRGGPKLTRRQVLISAAAAGSVLALHGVDTARAAGDASPAPPALAGVVERVELPGTLHVRYLGNRAGSAVVKIAAGATILRGIRGHWREFSTFVPGDEVVAMGVWEADVYRATALMSPFHPIGGRIVQRTDDSVQTPQATARLTPDTARLTGPGFVAKPLAQLAVGDEIVGEAWRDPVNGALLAARIGVLR